MIKKLLKSMIKFIICGSIVITLITQTPKLHRYYLRTHTGKEVVKIVNEIGNSGGTGVYINLPSGNKAILTNAHVCEVKNDKNIVWVKDSKNRAIPRKIIEISKISDLCLVEGLPNHRGLFLGSSVQLGQNISIIGHPRLWPKAMTSGEVFAKQFVQVLDHIIIDPVNDKCDLPKNRKIHEDGFFGPIDFCIEYIESLMTTAQILPGNSGSPVVNDYGQLVGLVYAGNELGWAIIIQLKDIKEFIKPY